MHLIPKNFVKCQNFFSNFFFPFYPKEAFRRYSGAHGRNGKKKASTLCVVMLKEFLRGKNSFVGADQCSLAFSSTLSSS